MLPRTTQGGLLQWKLPRRAERSRGGLVRRCCKLPTESLAVKELEIKPLPLLGLRILVGKGGSGVPELILSCLHYQRECDHVSSTFKGSFLPESLRKEALILQGRAYLTCKMKSELLQGSSAWSRFRTPGISRSMTCRGACRFEFQEISPT